MSVIFVSESDLAIFQAEEPVVADGDAVNIPAEIIQDGFRASKRRFGIHNPIDFETRIQELFKGLRLGQVFKDSMKFQ